MNDRPFEVEIEHLRRTPGARHHVVLTGAFYEDGSNGANREDRSGVTSVRLDAQMSCDLVLESFSCGIRVTGGVTAAWNGLCGRCAIDVDGLVVAAVDETFVDAIERRHQKSASGRCGAPNLTTRGGGARSRGGSLERAIRVEPRGTASGGEVERELEIGDTTVDLGPILRESIWLELPLVAVCDVACRGLCPGCGEDLNTSECLCVKRGDPRWTILDELK